MRCILAAAVGSAVFFLLSTTVADAATHDIEGRVSWPEEVTSPAKIKVALNLDSGHKLLAWPKSDGSFVLHGVPEGAHLLDVYAIGLVYPQVRLEVNAAYHGKILATLAENRSKVLPVPLHLRPVALAEYFEKREPFNVIGFLKTPYGMMAAFGLFAVFILPKLRVDPEDLKEATEALASSEPASASGAAQPQLQGRRRS